MGLAAALMFCLVLADAEGRTLREVGNTGGNPDDSRSFRSRSSLERLADELDRDFESQRRALERLSAIGSRAAVRAITQWLDETNLEAAEWLQACRALAPHARDAEAQKWLIRIFSGAELQGLEQVELSELTRATAATALTRSGHPLALAAIARALGQDPRSSKIASAALLAHPPRDLKPVLEAAGSWSLELISTLEELGDQRAFHPLRNMVRTGTAEVQARAALALFRMGHLETVELAEYWAKNARQQASLMNSAAEILLATRSKQGPAAFETLLGLNPDAALALASRFPHAKLPELLLAHERKFGVRAHPTLARVLGVCGGRDAMQALQERLTRDRTADDAAFALARSPDEAAERILSNAANQRATELLATRALVTRAWWNGRWSGELIERLEAFSKSKRDAQRYLGAWGLSVYSTDHAVELIREGQGVSAWGVAATLLTQPSGVLQRAAGRLDREEDVVLSAAFGASLNDRDAALVVHSSTLHRWLNARPELSLIAAAALSARVEQRFPARTDNLLRSADLAVRSEALRGLGDHPYPATLGELRRAYEESVQPKIRAAAIEGLGRRQLSGTRERTLAWASEYDPDARVRGLARTALGSSGARAGRLGGSQVLWLHLTSHSPGDLVLVTDDAGRSFAALVPPDKRLVVLGFSDGPFALRSTGTASSEPHENDESGQTHDAAPSAKVNDKRRK